MQETSRGYVTRVEVEQGLRVSVLHLDSCPESGGLGVRVTEETFGLMKGGLKRRCSCTIDHHRGRRS